MTVVKYSAATTEATLSISTNMDSKADGTSTLLCDLDFTGSGDREFYLFLWAVLGTINPSSIGSVRFSLRRKRGSTYALNDAASTEALPLTTGSGTKDVSGGLTVPGPFVYGLYFHNNAGATTAGSGNAVYAQEANEELV